eukprot:7134581-Pyramimonas_sp.AAC.1
MRSSATAQSGLRLLFATNHSITAISLVGAPCCLIHGAQWANIPSILSIGLSCRAADTIKKKGRQLVHACPYLPVDSKIQSGLRVDSE